MKALLRSAQRRSDRPATSDESRRVGTALQYWFVLAVMAVFVFVAIVTVGKQMSSICNRIESALTVS